MRVEGTGFTSGAGGWVGTHVPLPQGVVRHRPSEPKRDSGFKVHSATEFSGELLTKAERKRPARGKKARGDRRSDALSRAVIDEIVRLYRDEGLPSRQVAAALSVSQTCVMQYLRAEGVEIRPRGSSRRLPDVPKTCGFCGQEFRRREGEKAAVWSSRETCSRSCGGSLAAQRRFAS